MAPTKAELRANALQIRDGLDQAVRAAFTARLAAVGSSLVFGAAPGGRRPVVSVFSAIGSEPDATDLAAVLHAEDVEVALPVDWSHGAPLAFRRWMPGDRLAAGPLGIHEPLPDAPELEPDVLFIPLLAFDRRGHRVGYGAGNVDHTLAKLRARRVVRAIGVAYAIQEVPLVPNAPHDEPVDTVVTDREVIACAG